MLKECNIDFDTLPHWQRKGVNITWKDVEKEGWNPILNTPVITTRKELKADY